MPSKKRFESMDLNKLFSGENPISYQNMFEVSEHYYHHIKLILTYIDEGKQTTFEVPNENNAVYKIIRQGDEFLYKRFGDGANGEVMAFKEPIELINFLFRKAPFIAFVGEEKGKF